MVTAAAWAGIITCITKIADATLSWQLRTWWEGWSWAVHILQLHHNLSPRPIRSRCPCPLTHSPHRGRQQAPGKAKPPVRLPYAAPQQQLLAQAHTKLALLGIKGTFPKTGTLNVAFTMCESYSNRSPLTLKENEESFTKKKILNTNLTQAPSQKSEILFSLRTWKLCIILFSLFNLLIRGQSVISRNR